ncbi:hypothetical protein DERF_007437 [Dermatophagoides farinae]|uniref:Uncharacterized protein n=1 Tax=Dermatophagoides farinae TaxID=6954 RepID=A0A922L4H7_DERFA|nr:hypothetical protein DERF_007437 [Dermatophagoides farinae]
MNLTPCFTYFLQIFQFGDGIRSTTFFLDQIHSLWFKGESLFVFSKEIPQIFTSCLSEMKTLVFCVWDDEKT